MSLSHRNDQRIKPLPARNKSAKTVHWWDDLPTVMSCPECGKKAMRRASGPCELLDGTLIPELERFHCFACGADFFDDEAMGVIEKFRQRQSQKPSQLRLKTRVQKLEVA